MDVEAGGAAMTGGLIAGAIQKPEGHAGEVHADCADCGAPVHGNFCANCGQAAHVHRTLLHLGEEILHGVMHFDGRLWRTLPLLIGNPGRLTREWVEGRRTRYVSPLAIFLFTMFVMFFALSFVAQPKVNTVSVAERIAAEEAALASTEEELVKLRAELGQADATMQANTHGSERISSGVAYGTLSGAVASAEARLAAQKAKLDELKRSSTRVRTDGLVPGSWQAQLADSSVSSSSDGLAKTVQKKLQNPDLAVYKLQQTMYKFSFLLIPLSIPFMWLLFFWRRGTTLYDHGVFVLYSLTFMAMLGMATVVLAELIAPLATWIIALGCLAVPVHMFAQIKGAYGLKVFGALWRVLLLQVFCSIILGLFMAAIVYLGLGH